MRHIAIFVAIFIAASGSTAFSANADVSQQIGRNLIKAKVFAAGSSITAKVQDKNGFIKVEPYFRKSDEDMRIDAVLSAKTLVEAYPTIASVVTRFPDTQAGAYTDVFVTARQIISFGAGTMNRSELLSSLSAISVYPGEPARQVFEAYVREGDKAAQSGEPAKAEQMFAMSLSEAPSYTQAAGDERLVSGTLNLATYYQGREDYESAARVLQRVLDLRQGVGISDDPVTMKLSLALADVCIESGNTSQASALLERVIQAKSTTSGSDVTEQARLIEKLAGLCKETPAREEELLRRAITMRETAVGHEDANMVQSLERLGDCCMTGANAAEARKFYKRAIEILNKAMVAKDKNRRISYELYNASMTRIQRKLTGTSEKSGRQVQF